jgi:hypothetical protein
MFTVNKVPGFAAQMRRDNLIKSDPKHLEGSSTGKCQEGCVKTRDSSPKMPRPRSEEIPLEDMRLRKNSLIATPVCVTEHVEIGAVVVSTPDELETPTKKRSEETSFTEKQSNESRSSRRKGKIETI